jgi:calcium uptake protein 1, mitochondrial
VRSQLLQSIQHKPNLQNFRGHKNFGHEPEETPKVTRYWYAFLISIFLGCTLDWKKWVGKFFLPFVPEMFDNLCFRFKRAIFPPVDADAGVVPSSELGTEDSNDANEDQPIDQQHRRRPKKEKVGFRDRKVRTSVCFPTFLDSNRLLPPARYLLIKFSVP